MIENRSKWQFSPSTVAHLEISGSFTTEPAAVSQGNMKGNGGTAEIERSATKGIEVIASYDGPDKFKLVIYALLPYYASTDPVCKVCCD